jgi:hypothetical protein
VLELPQQAASLHMQMVILWSNGNVMVLDELGEQMPEYQGIFERVAPRINAVFRGSWKYGDWNRGIISDTPLPMVSEQAWR